MPGTALPGEVGNFASPATGSRPATRSGACRACAAASLVYVETVAGTYEYQVSGRPRWVSPDDTAVLAPVPYHPGQPPRQRMITLITCDPPWTGTNRVIVTGVLVRTLPRAQGIEG